MFKICQPKYKKKTKKILWITKHFLLDKRHDDDFMNKLCAFLHHICLQTLHLELVHYNLRKEIFCLQQNNQHISFWCFPVLFTILLRDIWTWLLQLVLLIFFYPASSHIAEGFLTLMLRTFHVEIYSAEGLKNPKKSGIKFYITLRKNKCYLPRLPKNCIFRRFFDLLCWVVTDS